MFASGSVLKVLIIIQMMSKFNKVKTLLVILSSPQEPRLLRPFSIPTSKRSFISTSVSIYQYRMFSRFLYARL